MHVELWAVIMLINQQEGLAKITYSSDKCNLSNEEYDMRHAFLSCTPIRTFWSEVEAFATCINYDFIKLKKW